MSFLKYLFFLGLFFLGILFFFLHKTFISFPFFAHEEEKPNSFSNYLMGMHARYKRDPELEIKYLKKVLEAEPTNFKIHADIVVASAISNNQTVIKDLVYNYGNIEDKALLLFTALVTENFHLAGKDKAKEKFYYKSARLYTKHFPKDELSQLISSLLAAWSLIGEQYDQEAIKILKSLKTSKMYNFLVQYHLGLIYSYKKEYEKAESLFEEILRNFNGSQISLAFFERVIYNYAIFLQKQKKYEKLEKFIQKTRQKFTYPYRLDNFYKKLQENKISLFEITNSSKGAAEVLFDIGLFLEKENSTFFLIYLRLSEYLTSENNANFYYVGLKLFELGYFEYALSDLKKIDKNSLYYPDSLLHIILYYLEVGDKKNASKSLKLIKKYGEDDRRVDLLSLLYYTSNNKWDKAYKYLLSCLEKNKKLEKNNLKPFNWILDYQIAQIYEHYQKIREAEFFLRRSLKSRSKDPYLINYFGYFLIQNKNEIAESLKFFSFANYLLPNNPYILDSLGYAYYLSKDYSRAMRYLEQALTYNSNSLEINKHLKCVYKMLQYDEDEKFQKRHINKIEKDYNCYNLSKKMIQNKIKEEIINSLKQEPEPQYLQSEM